MELGPGDGRYLCQLSKDEQDNGILFVGIERNEALYREAIGRIDSDRVVLVNGDFENRILDFENETIDKVIMILPDPEYVDRHYHDDWISLYANILLKLRKLGKLEIVTETIDELLQPVSDAAYFIWANWLLATFIQLGFGVEEILNKAPDKYATTCLDRFRQDPDRIRMLTLRLFKP